MLKTLYICTAGLHHQPCLYTTTKLGRQGTLGWGGGGGGGGGGRELTEQDSAQTQLAHTDSRVPSLKVILNDCQAAASMHLSLW